MSGKDARKKSQQHALWKTRLSILLGVGAVIAVCATARCFIGTESANAQRPQTQAPRTLPSRTQTTQKPAPITTPQRTTGRNTVAPASGQQAIAPRQRSTTKKAIPDVVAHVNNQQITRQQLANECLKRYGPDVVEAIINKHVVWQECQRRGIQITEADVDNEITRMATKFRLTPERWLQMLQEERDMSEQEYRTEIVWLTLALKELAAEEIVVSDQEVQTHIESEYGAKVKARIIAVASKQQAEQIRAKAVLQPETFGSLAKQYSIDPSSGVQGVIPPIRKHIGDPAYATFERAAFSLKEGQISPVVPLADKFVIIKCDKVLHPNYLSAAVRQNAELQIRNRLEEQKMRASAASTFGQLQKQATIVNVYNDEHLREKMPGVAATVNGKQVTIRELSEECMKRYGKSVLDGEINRVMLTQALQKRQRTVDQRDIDEELSRAADMYGFVKDGKPDVQAWVKAITEQDKVSVDVYIQDAVWPSVALKKLVDQQVKITEDDLQKGFESNYGVRIQVKAIVLSNFRQAQEIWDTIQKDPSAENFGRLAAKYSIEPISKENEGQVPPVRKHSGQPIIEKAAFDLGPTGIESLSGIVTVGDKYIILKYMGKTDPVVKQMDADIRRELLNDLREKKLRIAMGAEFDRLKETTSIHNFLTGTSTRPQRSTAERLFPANGQTQPAVPGLRR